MGWTGGTVLERVQRASGVVLSSTAAILVLSLLTTQPPSVAMLAAAATVVAALLATRPMTVTPLGRALAPRSGGLGHLPAIRAGSTTDSPRHPRRPRAPGTV